jgi:preprotein translocase subunit SecA
MLEMSPAAFRDLSTAEAEALIRERIDEHYRSKEIQFPVAVGMTRFLADKSVNQKDSRERLAHWAGSRFEAPLRLDEFKSLSTGAIESILTEHSRRFFVNGDAIAKIDNFLDRAYGERNGRDHSHEAVEHAEEVPEFARWVNQEFQSQLQPRDLERLTREEARQKVLSQYDHRYRPELAQAERALLLEVLDQGWKDHLYYMDHLRQGIGLVSYAQRDPKVEYKREGRKAFKMMWESVDQQVTRAIFRLDKESPNFVGSLWEITAATHAEFQPGAESGDTATSAPPQPGETTTAIEPIRNRQPKVGRNDPCPCGSGKKYKKCCGANA